MTQNTKQLYKPVDWIVREFEIRRERNSRYSLRAFARSLSMNPGRLSQLINGKRNVSLKLGETLAVAFSLSPNEKEEFLQAITREKQRNRKIIPTDDSAKDRYLEEEHFRLISEPHHIAILILLATKDFQSSPRWISERLGIPSITAKDAIERLQELGLMQVVDGKFSTKETHITTGLDKTYAAAKITMRKHIEAALQSLDDDPPEHRSATCFTFSFTRERLPEAKEEIIKFQRRMDHLFGNDKEPDEVYNLNIQFVPVTKINS